MFREFKNLDKIFIYILHLISVEENGTVNYWKNSDELAGQVRSSLEAELVKDLLSETHLLKQWWKAQEIIVVST